MASFPALHRRTATIVTRILLQLSILALPSGLFADEGQWCIQLSHLYFSDQPFAMSREVPALGPVRKQCGGTCWANAAATATEHRLKSASGQNIRVSVEFYMTRVIGERFLKAIKNGFETYTEDVAPERVERRLGRKLTKEEVDRLSFEVIDFPAADGGTPDLFPRMLRSYGVMPEATFTKVPKINYREMNQRLAIAAENYRSLYEKASNPADRAALEQKIVLWLESFLAKNIGSAPTKFVWNGQETTPKALYEQLDPLSSRKIKTVYHSAFAKAKFANKSNEFYESTSAEMPEMLNLIRSEIDQGRSVYGGFLWSRKMLELAGVMNVEANRPMFGDATPVGRHAVAIVGYALDASGNNITALKIQNSWGNKRGKDGFYVVAPKEFWETVRYVQLPAAAVAGAPPAPGDSK
jgi:hypothetical protein